MNTKTLHKKLGHFRSFSNQNGTLIFQSRANLGRIVKVFEKEASSFAIPLFIDSEGNETVAFHATSIKSLVEFLGKAA